MKISSDGKRSKPLDRSTAWGCVMSNSVVLPGLGTLAAGRRTGYFQAALASFGLILLNIWLFSFFRFIWIEKDLPLDGGPHFKLGMLGLAIVGGAWIWALLSSIQIMKAAKTLPSEPPVQDLVESKNPNEGST